MNEIILFYYNENGYWYKTWAENHGGEYGVLVKSTRVSANTVDSNKLRTAEQADLTILDLLEHAKTLY